MTDNRPPEMKMYAASMGSNDPDPPRDKETWEQREKKEEIGQQMLHQVVNKYEARTQKKMMLK
jgi:hypothetical protein